VSAKSGTGTAEPAADGSRRAQADREPPPDPGQLFGIGAAAARAGVTERALRYYQQIGLLSPRHCTPGGMRRYSEQDLARVARIRQLQMLLGLNLEEVAVVLRNEDRIAEIRRACGGQHTTDAQRLELARESLQLQQDLRAAVEAKRQAINGFLADLDTRIARTTDWLAQMTTEPEPRQRLPGLPATRAAGYWCAWRWLCRATR
jgi:DNA-binding transcriptional MerR regulator